MGTIVSTWLLNDPMEGLFTDVRNKNFGHVKKYCSCQKCLCSRHDHSSTSSCWSLRPPFTIRRMYIAKVMTHHMAANDRDIVKLLIERRCCIWETESLTFPQCCTGHITVSLRDEYFIF